MLIDDLPSSSHSRKTQLEDTLTQLIIADKDNDTALISKIMETFSDKPNICIAQEVEADPGQDPKLAMMASVALRAAGVGISIDKTEGLGGLNFTTK